MQQNTQYRNIVRSTPKQAISISHSDSSPEATHAVGTNNYSAKPEGYPVQAPVADPEGEEIQSRTPIQFGYRFWHPSNEEINVRYYEN